MTRQHKQSLLRTMEVAFKHRRVSVEMSTAVVGIEAMVASGIDNTEVVKNTDKKVLGRSISCLAHKSFGTRMADAVSTIDQIIADEALVIVEQDKEVKGNAAHKAGLDKVVKDEITRRIEGKKVSSIVTKAEQVVDQLLVIYGVGGAKDDAPTAANLAEIKTILDS